VKQDYREAFHDVNHANYAMLIFLHLSAIAIIIVSIFITRHLIEIIKNRDVEADHLNRQLMQTGKLAAVGELSAGVAHEINNPLAIILTEKQILLDLVEQTKDLNVDFKDALLSSLSQLDNQVKRCKRITQGLLRFARRTVSVIEPVDLNLFLRELIELVEREARSSGIKFIPEFEKDLKPLLSDPSQLQQVFLNIITNAIDAHDDKPYGTIRVQTAQNGNESGVNVIISDTGSGIMPENMDKIFDPFFTTKPVGKGTGLGLSICYSIIADLGGNINVESTPGQGTTFAIHLPFLPPPELEKDKNVNQSTINM
jgi:two-component system NtrC family sensor kinase